MVSKPQNSDFKNLICCFLKISFNLKMRARHKYKINYKSLLLNLNCCYYNDTSGKKSSYITDKFMCCKNKYFQWAVGGKDLKKNKRIKVLSDVKNGQKSEKIWLENFLNHMYEISFDKMFSALNYKYTQVPSSVKSFSNSFFTLRCTEKEYPRPPPNPISDWGGYSSKFEFENHLSWNEQAVFRIKGKEKMHKKFFLFF